MIAKRIQRKSNGNGKGLLAYVGHVKDKGKGDPTEWKLLPYIVDGSNDGEKLAWEPRISNCQSTEYGWASKELLALAACNTRSKGDRFYHLVVSFPEGERPTREQMEQIEDRLCDGIGLGKHKRLSAVHDNTENLHLHVAICLVDPDSYRKVEPYYDHTRLQELCIELEQELGLTRDNHTPAPERPTNGKARDMEVHAKRISFERWIKERGPELVKAATLADTWQAVHSEFNRYGVVIKPRGAGFIISTINNDKVRIKASDVHRSLSMGSLTGRLGEYEPPAEIERPKPEQTYEPRPINSTPELDNLWDRYCAERDAARAARDQALTDLRVRHQQYALELRQWYAKRYANARAQHLNRGDRIATFTRLRESRVADKKRTIAREKNDRSVVKGRFPVITWAEFLERETRAGNDRARDALTQLRSPDRFSVETELFSRHTRSDVTEQGRDANSHGL